jgi:hypothetical protein
MVWMATPVHLIAGLASVHLDPHGILRPAADELTRLAEDFARTFQDPGLQLLPLEGEFLLLGPELPPAQTPEPARALGDSVAEALPKGPGAAPLRRLGTEIEMWLHGHAVNDARAGRGAPLISGLWLWGAGPANEVQARPSNATRASSSESGHPQFVAFGSDSFVRGLCVLNACDAHPLPEQLVEVFGYPPVPRTLVVVEVGRMLQLNPGWNLLDALSELDRRFLAPATQALHAGRITHLGLLANDVRLGLRRRDRFKRWRRARGGLTGLQSVGP